MNSITEIFDNGLSHVKTESARTGDDTAAQARPDSCSGSGSGSGAQAEAVAQGGFRFQQDKGHGFDNDTIAWSRSVDIGHTVKTSCSMTEVMELVEVHEDHWIDIQASGLDERRAAWADLLHAAAGKKNVEVDEGILAVTWEDDDGIVNMIRIRDNARNPN